MSSFHAASGFTLEASTTRAMAPATFGVANEVTLHVAQPSKWMRFVPASSSGSAFIAVTKVEETLSPGVQHATQGP